MGINLHLPKRFYYLWQGRKTIEVKGNTVAECIDDLSRIIPLMKKALSYDSGKIDPEIKVLVNDNEVGAEGLAKEVTDGDEIHFVLGTH